MIRMMDQRVIMPRCGSVLLWCLITSCLVSKGVVPLSSSSVHQGKHSSIGESSTPFFLTHKPPFLAVITEQSSCDSEDDLNRALGTLYSAVSSGAVDLVSVRINLSTDAADDEGAGREGRLRSLISHLLKWRNENSTFTYSIVVSSDWMRVGLDSGADGIHFKEAHRDQIPVARRLRPNLLVGTSTHSVESAREAIAAFNVDYFFCGTCYPTESHPEKDVVEGPQLPSQVKGALSSNQSTPVFAIGGLDASNAHLQFTESLYVQGERADGVATIRAVLAARNPGQAAIAIRRAMVAASQEK